eukprot:gene13165-biopygen12535
MGERGDCELKNAQYSGALAQPHRSVHGACVPAPLGFGPVPAYAVQLGLATLKKQTLGIGAGPNIQEGGTIACRACRQGFGQGLGKPPRYGMVNSASRASNKIELDKSGQARQALSLGQAQTSRARELGKGLGKSGSAAWVRASH